MINHFVKTLSLLFVLIFCQSTAFSASPSCEDLFGHIKLIETLRAEPLDEMLPAKKLEDLQSPRLYQLKRKELLKKLSQPINYFKNQHEFDQFTLDLVEYLYPKTFKEKILFWQQNDSKILEQEAKKSLIRNGLYKTINDSEISLDEKRSWLSHAGEVVSVVLQPWTVANYFDSSLTAEEARDFLLNGTEQAMRSPEIQRKFLLHRDKAYLRTFISMTVLSLSILAYQQQSLANQIQQDQRRDQYVQSLKELKKTQEVDITAQIQNIQYLSLVSNFKKEFHRNPYPNEDAALRKAVLPNH